jgi:hypothetical protein
MATQRGDEILKAEISHRLREGGIFRTWVLILSLETRFSRRRGVRGAMEQISEDSHICSVAPRRKDRDGRFCDQLGHESIETTSAYLGSDDFLTNAVNDSLPLGFEG